MLTTRWCLHGLASASRGVQVWAFLVAFATAQPLPGQIWLPSPAVVLQLAAPEGGSAEAEPIVVVPSAPPPATSPPTGPAVAAADLQRDPYSRALEAFQSGKYEECLRGARAEMESHRAGERWPRIVLETLLVLGQNQEAEAVYEDVITQYPNSLPLRRLGYEVYRSNGRKLRADQEHEQIAARLRATPWRFNQSAALVALGKYFLAQGEDARQVLELCYDRAIKLDPQSVEAHLATAELALEKHDAQLAAAALAKAEALAPGDPQVHYLLARAWHEGDSQRAARELAIALKRNPRHVPSLLWAAEQAIDAEQWDDASATLDMVMLVHPDHREALAYRAVVAHLRGDFAAEKRARQAALERCTDDPRVDFWIGRKLSQHYRFAEGATYQRQALAVEPQFLPARMQLAQDLLHLGQDEEGWQIVHQVRAADQYHVVAHNLVELHQQLEKYVSTEQDGFVLRMERREFAVYGQQVLALLVDARDALCEKYRLVLDAPVIVEIFPRQQDFAIRTFGLPGGQGYLGVCFGNLITANSPASRTEHPSNWQAVLWHEMCHVVTLNKTRNRMPRWLSEGISVYEERQRNHTWGERLRPVYRAKLRADNLTPVSMLSSAFLRPGSALDLQFAYYQSSLVVEFFVAQYGHAALVRMLDDLADGIGMNDVLQRHTGSLPAFDEAFAEFARGRAAGLAPDLEWDAVADEHGQSDDDWLAYAQQHPRNYWALKQAAAVHLRRRQWQAAEEILATLRDHFPNDVGHPNALSLSVQLYRGRRRYGARGRDV